MDTTSNFSSRKCLLMAMESILLRGIQLNMFNATEVHTTVKMVFSHIFTFHKANTCVV
jgi:hypothetical protein